MTTKETLLHTVWAGGHWGSRPSLQCVISGVFIMWGKIRGWCYSITTMVFCLNLLIDSRMSPVLRMVLLSTGILRCHKSSATVLKGQPPRASSHCCSAKDWNWKVRTVPKGLWLNTEAPPYSTVMMSSYSNLETNILTQSSDSAHTCSS